MQTTTTNSKPAISCIFVNYHSGEFLESSLESLFHFEKDVSFEVILVNNDAREQQKLRSLQKRFNAKLIESFGNPGFATSANLGSQSAEGELLYFVNPDTKWHESFFQKVIVQFQVNKKLGILGIPLLSPNGKSEHKSKGNFFQFSRLFPFLSSNSVIEWVSGGALFIPQEKFHAIKGFDEQFFLYFEDMDLCLRMKESGSQVLLLKGASLTHFNGKSHSDRKSQKKFYDESLYKYTKKHWSNFHYTLIRVIHPVFRFFFPYGRS